MGHRISARCLSYCHIATLAGRSQNTPTRVAHQHTCDSIDVHAHLRRMQYHSTLVIPANEGLHLCRIRRFYLDHDTLAHWRPIPVVNLSETRCQHEPASPAALICVDIHIIALHSGSQGSRRASSRQGASGDRTGLLTHTHWRLEPIGVHRAAAVSLRNPRPDLTDRMPETCSLALVVGTIQSSGPG